MGTIGTRTKLSDRGIFHGCRCPVYHHFVDDTLFHLYVRYDRYDIPTGQYDICDDDPPSEQQQQQKKRKKKKKKKIS